MADFGFIPVNKKSEPCDARVEALAKALLLRRSIYDGKNIYAPKPAVSTEGRFVDRDTPNSFVPSDAEIKAALDAFREKGYLIAYDNDICEYRICTERSDIKGDYAIRHTIWL